MSILRYCKILQGPLQKENEIKSVRNMCVTTQLGTTWFVHRVIIKNKMADSDLSFEDFSRALISMCYILGEREKRPGLNRRK